MIAAWLPGIAESALFEPDEGRNASIALAMAAGGSWLVPQLNGLPFLDKPFLFFSLQALSFRWLGYSELAARLPSLLAGALLVASITAFAWRRRGPRIAWLTAVSSSGSMLLIVFARVASFDALLTLFTTVAIVAFFEAAEPMDPARARVEPWLRRRWLGLAWLAICLGTFTKGPVALALPFVVMGVYATLRRRWRALWSAGSVVAGLGVLLLWTFLVEQRAPGFLRYALVEESLHRTATSQFHRGGPIWYFLPILLVGAFPWILPAAALAAKSLRRVRATAPDQLLAAIWLVVPLFLLSLSQSKRPQYMLLLLPAIALLSGQFLGEASARRRTIRIAAVTWLALATLLAAAIFWRESLSEMNRALDGAAPLRLAVLFAAVAAGSGLAAWFRAKDGRVGILLAALPVVLVPWLARDVILEAAEARSARSLVAALDPLRQNGVQLVGIDSFMTSLPFYWRSPIILSAPSLRTLTSQSMLHFEPEIRRSEPQTLRSEEWWRSELAGDRHSSAFLIRKGRDAEISILESAGLRPLFENQKYLVYGPGEARHAATGSGPSTATVSSTTGGPALRRR